MIQLQKVISAVGMFAIFEAHLQDQLNCEHGFRKANQILKIAGQVELCQQFMKLQDAINILKHGRGRSYEKLLEISETLSFRIKEVDELFFNEDDVSEVFTLIEVDDRFVELCADVIYRVSTVLNNLNGKGDFMSTNKSES